MREDTLRESLGKKADLLCYADGKERHNRGRVRRASENQS